MTFLVEDNQLVRHKRIKKFIDDGEPVISVILAAADFEWTVRRAILALGKSPNADIRAGVLARCSGLNSYRDAWKAEVKPRFGLGLPEVISEWESFKVSFALRHRLVHGVAGTTGLKYAATRVERILQGSTELADYAANHAIDLFARLPVRIRRIAK